jgi:hypothetical protein
MKMLRVNEGSAGNSLRSVPSIEPWLPLIGAILKEINATVRSEKAVKDTAEDQRVLARDMDDDALDAMMLRDSADANALKFWRQYSINERAEVASLFRELCERGKLPKEVWKDQREAVERGMSYQIVFSQPNGYPVVEPIMQFDKDPQRASEAKLALALMALAGQGQTGYRVLPCAHKNCGRLFIRSPAERGPKREACELHVDAYRQARWRDPENQKKRAAAKHK